MIAASSMYELGRCSWRDERKSEPGFGKDIYNFPVGVILRTNAGIGMCEINQNFEAVNLAILSVKHRSSSLTYSSYQFLVAFSNPSDVLLIFTLYYHVFDTSVGSKG